MLLLTNQKAETMEMSIIEKATLMEMINQFIQKHQHPPSRAYVSYKMTDLVGKIVKGVHIYYGSGLHDNQVMFIL
jgi:hypothetical protein